MNISFKSYWNLLSDHIRPQRRRFTLLALMLFGSIGLRIFAPQIMRKFIDSALATRLGANRALLHSEEQGTLEKFRPYRLPSADWLDQLRRQLQAPAANGSGLRSAKR